MATAVTSLLKATQIANTINDLRSRRKPDNVYGDVSGGARGRKVAPAVQPKPQVPVAVVHGKRSLKRSAVNIINRYT
jgi:hypothetical protein